MNNEKIRMQGRLSSYCCARPRGYLLREHGGTMLGLIVGLVVGLALALIVALVITKGPIPFVNKVGHSSTPTPAGDEAGQSRLPDPNKPLYSKEIPIPPVPVYSAPESVPTSAAAPESQASKPSYLQAGAFKNAADADNMKAKLALLGFEAQISQAAVNNEVVQRVRLGPFGRVDDLNRARQRLAESGIDASVASAAVLAPAVPGTEATVRH